MKKGLTAFSLSTSTTTNMILGFGLPVSAGVYPTFAGIFGADSPDSLEAEIQATCPIAVAINNLYVDIVTAAGAGNGITVTLRKNGADTALTATVSGASATNAQDTTHSVVFAAGDRIAWHMVQVGTMPTRNVSVMAQLT